METESLQTSPAGDKKERMTLDKHKALAAQVEQLKAEVAELKAAAGGINEALPKPSGDIDSRLANLEQALIKVASIMGAGNHLPEFGFSMWTPGKKDMRKYN